MGLDLTVNLQLAGVRGRRAPGTLERRVKGRRAHPQEALDLITRRAGGVLRASAVCASLIDAERRLWTSSFGLPLPIALLLSHAFRKHVVATARPLVIADG